jgi:transcriptional regulator with XRE-family HTH domain
MFVSTDQGPVVQGALLRNELVRLRRESRLTQQQVADELEWSASKLIRVEGGHSSITKVDLDALLSIYGVKSESGREFIHALNRAARERGWWHSYRDDVSATYLSYIGLEAGASFIRQFQNGFIPGLLQTPEYAKVVTEVSALDEEKVDSVVRVRMRRQSELAKRSSQPRQHFIIDEGVIRRHIGINRDPEMMPAQLRRVADRAERDELITVGVVPFEAGAYPGLFGPFTLLEFEGGLPDILYLDAGRGDFTIASGDDPRISEYAADFERLLEDALPAQESIQLIRSAAAEMSKQTS